jgi:Domain of unknown function (DUF4336)
MGCLEPYGPVNTLKPVADNLWIVDGPVIRMSWLGFPLPFTTRMTVIRFEDGALWLHSPTPPADALCREIEKLGNVRFLIAPNRIHYWWIGEWKQRYADAITYAAPGVRAWVADFDRDLGEQSPGEWQGINLVLVAGDFLTEIDFFHRPSRTLILTDLIENFEPARITCWHLRLLMKLGGVTDPDGKTPYDLRLTFLRHKPPFRAAIEVMLAWRPQRIVLAHGRWYPENGEAELRRAFRWLL